MLKKEEKTIEIRNGNNKKLIVGIILAVLVVGVLLTSKLWLPDDRPVVKKNVGVELTYTKANIIETTEFKRDLENNYFETAFKIERYTANKEPEDFDYKLMINGDTEVEIKVILGEIENVTELRTNQEVIIQTILPEDIYFLELIISEKDVQSQSIIVDYRDMIEAVIIPKGDDYLKATGEYKREKSGLEARIIEIEERLEKIAEEMDKKDITEDKKKSLSEEKTKINDELTEAKARVRELERIVNE